MQDAGDVICWRNFPYPRDARGGHKTRWFVCLGRSGLYAQPVFVYLCTPTTVSRYYEAGGERANNQHLRITRGEQGFTEDCILDVDVNLYDDITADQLTKAQSDIEYIRKADEEFMRRIWKLVLGSVHVSRKVKADIHNCLNLSGITNLKRP